MSIKNVPLNNIVPKNTDTIATNPQNNSWVRNPSWVAFPSITSSDNKFVGIYAVYNTTDNFVALNAAGNNFNVDWGDGTTSLNNASVVNKNFSYSSAALAGTNAPVTLTDSTDLVTRTAHGYTNGMTVSFYNIVSTTGLTEGQIYYVINATTDTFQVSATVGGSAIALTTDGTATLLPYKQAIVTVTPVSGQTFTTIDLARLPNQSGLVTSAGINWLDVAMAGSSLSTITMTNITLTFPVCERFRILKCTKTSFVTFFSSTWTALCSFELSGTTGITALNGLFQSCTKLTDVYFDNLSSVQNMSTMFSGCSSLTSVSLPSNTPALTQAGSTFSNCYNLKVAPYFNTASVTSMNSMFQGCYRLTYVPLYNTVSNTDMSNMFSDCYSLPAIPFFNTASVTLFTGTFTNCRSLTTIPLFNTASVTNMQTTFYGCSSLTTIPLLNTANVLNMNAMFTNCNSLISVPALNTIKVTNMGNMFSTCTSLRTVSFTNTVAVTTMTTMFTGCVSLKTVPLFNTGAVLTINGMFSNCTSLESVPLFNLANVTNMSAMFQNCTVLKTVPAFNPALATNVANLFENCRALVTIPAINFNSVTTLATTSMFLTCTNISAIKMINMRNTFSVASLKLSGAALDEIYTNLPTITSRTITVTGNYGTTTDTPSIATAKGWAVTG
jgi:surface protein